MKKTNHWQYIRTGIVHLTGGIEFCRKHKTIWEEGSDFGVCMECINKSHRDRRFKKTI